ncbi:hypothetical protein HHK36_024255 [Tetracentron sinense]|uniref:Uncharacterized protein n=1 Tax=Tetracentron sinense TaxID=13715 RepID=A0A834YQ81_TETSI|nr:hypothetical protein HHK36_024255 [Tetracentron sinense]
MDVGDEERIGFSGEQVGDEVRMTFSGREVGDEIRTAISGGEVGDEVRTAFSGGEVSPQLFSEAFTNTSVYNGDQYEWKLVVRIYRKKYTLPGSSGRWLFGEGEHPALAKHLVCK